MAVADVCRALGIDGLDGGYRITVSAAAGGGDRIHLTLAGSGGDDAAEAVSKRFKSQTLISADEIEIVPELEEGPVLVDERTG